MTASDSNTHSDIFINIKLPDAAKLKNLAVSESGFIFDPTTGHSFSVNETGLVILQLLQKDNNLKQIQTTLLNDYLVDKTKLERDLIEFVGVLRKRIQEPTT